MTIARCDPVNDPVSKAAPSYCWRLAAVVLLVLVGSSPGNAQRYDNNRDADQPRSDEGRGRNDRDSGSRRGGGGAIVRCESTGQDYQHCRADTSDGVQLYRQLSRNACRFNDSWGYDRRGVWVKQGCRGDFQLHTGRSGGNGQQQGRDNTAAIVGGAVALGVLGAVLSENDNGNNNNGNNNNSDRPRRTVRCESDGDYRHCRAEIRNGVRLSRQLSRASCRQNESWGYDRRGVWVDRGCRAEFSLD
ncbi:MAG: DUF3011 domain-containing protein [Candidatus Competibacteraceae bacterium]|uniref:DUF3011 domain-containing protein n=1 Tax=Candidatus Contendobacter odensis Run_B_J11 TaxID=1400861 RepID=A0A7U7J2X0_9GAMM|nr:DUF3011 domain-containing protein [Candidatus Contendobacter odensis]MBK8537130.1 DUF3011 domain-containing protein [Candidatus Competibacteraceae bacterium]CDH43629.1 hypothetical protein BN874_1260037 [Candidatus Contendobacter odensis Run_B_J11]